MYALTCMIPVRMAETLVLMFMLSSFFFDWNS